MMHSSDSANAPQNLDAQVEALHAYIEGLDELCEDGERMLRSLDRGAAERADNAQNELQAIESDIQQS